MDNNLNSKKSEKPHYLGHRQRLKDRFRDNPKNIADYEFLELLLGYVLLRQDTKQLAKSLLDKFTSLQGILDAEDYELSELKTVGSGVILFKNILREFQARVAKSILAEKNIFTEPSKVAVFLQKNMQYLQNEEMWGIFLNNQNILIKFEKIQSGTPSQIIITPRHLISKALACGASAIILAHNHPGGVKMPSIQDKSLTNKITALLKEVEIRMLDHLIITKSGYFSFKEEGLLD